MNKNSSSSGGKKRKSEEEIEEIQRRMLKKAALSSVYKKLDKVVKKKLPIDAEDDADIEDVDDDDDEDDDDKKPEKSSSEASSSSIDSKKSHSSTSQTSNGDSSESISSSNSSSTDESKKKKKSSLKDSKSSSQRKIQSSHVGRTSLKDVKEDDEDGSGDEVSIEEEDEFNVLRPQKDRSVSWTENRIYPIQKAKYGSFYSRNDSRSPHGYRQNPYGSYGGRYNSRSFIGDDDEEEDEEEEDRTLEYMSDDEEIDVGDRSLGGGRSISRLASMRDVAFGYMTTGQNFNKRMKLDREKPTQTDSSSSLKRSKEGVPSVVELHQEDEEDQVAQALKKGFLSRKKKQ